MKLRLEAQYQGRDDGGSAGCGHLAGSCQRSQYQRQKSSHLAGDPYVADAPLIVDVSRSQRAGDGKEREPEDEGAPSRSASRATAPPISPRSA